MSANSSTTSQWLNSSEAFLKDAGIDTARLDCLVLLEDVTGKNRAHLLAHPELELTTEQIKQLDNMVQRRATHEPLAYIRGKAEFYGREFTVNQQVLVPRPESEDILEMLDQYGDIPTIVDVGTGSGALAISAKLQRKDSQVYAIDTDENCIAIARQNAKRLHAAIEFLQGDLLRPLKDRPITTPLAVLANLPYVPNDYTINQAAKHEPPIALFGGADGLDLYRVMFNQLTEYDEEDVIVFTESLEGQHHTLTGIASSHGFILGQTKGLIQELTRTRR